ASRSHTRTFAARSKAGHGPMVLTASGGALVRPGTPDTWRSRWSGTRPSTAEGPLGRSAPGGWAVWSVRESLRTGSIALDVPRDRRTVLRDPRTARRRRDRHAGRRAPARDRLGGRARLVRGDRPVLAA